MLRKNNRAQQIIEYLLVTAVVAAGITAFVGPGGHFKDIVGEVINQSLNIIDEGTNDLCVGPNCQPPGSYCGDGICNTVGGETWIPGVAGYCPEDCQAPGAYCGDGYCDDDYLVCIDDTDPLHREPAPESGGCGVGFSGPVPAESCYDCNADCSSCCGNGVCDDGNCPDGSAPNPLLTVCQTAPTGGNNCIADYTFNAGSGMCEAPPRGDTSESCLSCEVDCGECTVQDVYWTDPPWGDCIMCNPCTNGGAALTGDPKIDCSSTEGQRRIIQCLSSLTPAVLNDQICLDVYGTDSKPDEVRACPDCTYYLWEKFHYGECLDVRSCTADPECFNMTCGQVNPGVCEQIVNCDEGVDPKPSRKLVVEDDVVAGVRTPTKYSNGGLLECLEFVRAAQAVAWTISVAINDANCPQPKPQDGLLCATTPCPNPGNSYFEWFMSPWGACSVFCDESNGTGPPLGKKIRTVYCERTIELLDGTTQKTRVQDEYCDGTFEGTPQCSGINPACPYLGPKPPEEIPHPEILDRDSNVAFEEQLACNRHPCCGDGFVYGSEDCDPSDNAPIDSPGDDNDYPGAYLHPGGEDPADQPDHGFQNLDGEQCSNLEVPVRLVASDGGLTPDPPIPGSMFDGGVLWCNNQNIDADNTRCKFNLDDCLYCGDLEINDATTYPPRTNPAEELCDRTNLPWTTCADWDADLFYPEDTDIFCTTPDYSAPTALECRENISQCDYCGDSLIFRSGTPVWEECDCGTDGACTAAELDGQNCSDFIEPVTLNPYYDDTDITGTPTLLTCTDGSAGVKLDRCHFDPSSCNFCGNGLRENPPEECEDPDYGNVVNNAGLPNRCNVVDPSRFHDNCGTLSCYPPDFTDADPATDDMALRCMYDTSNCCWCGDGRWTPDEWPYEECDYMFDPPWGGWDGSTSTATCDQVSAEAMNGGLGVGFFYCPVVGPCSTASCSDVCIVDATNCEGYCGDGSLQMDHEDCEYTDYTENAGSGNWELACTLTSSHPDGGTSNYYYGTNSTCNPADLCQVMGGDCWGYCGDNSIDTELRGTPPESLEQCDWGYHRDVANGGDGSGFLSCSHTPATGMPNGRGNFYPNVMSTNSTFCGQDCNLSVIDCSGYCGDGSYQDQYEDCDFMEFGGIGALRECTTVPAPYPNGTGNWYGHPGDQVGCSNVSPNHCTLINNNCDGYCGDGTFVGQEEYEECDYIDFETRNPIAPHSLTCENISSEGLNFNGVGNFYGTGTATCSSADCSLDISQCQGYCGDGIIQNSGGLGEECDIALFGGGAVLCVNIPAPEGGVGNWYSDDIEGDGPDTASCSNAPATACKLENNDCDGYCGDRTLQVNHEQCELYDDGTPCMFVSAEGLGGVGQFYAPDPGYMVYCPDCAINIDNCEGFCGDGTFQEDYEQCDFKDFVDNYGGSRFCEDTPATGMRNGDGVGFFYSDNPGTDSTTCGPNACTLNGAACAGYCGDGVYQPDHEDCDYVEFRDSFSAPFNLGRGGFAHQCDLTPIPGTTNNFSSGGMAFCRPDCTMDFADCNGICGDGFVMARDGEICDTADPATQTKDCTTMTPPAPGTGHYYTGIADCEPLACSFYEHTNCSGYCNDGILQPGAPGSEQCDQLEYTNISGDPMVTWIECTQASAEGRPNGVGNFYGDPGDNIDCNGVCQIRNDTCKGYCGDGINQYDYEEECDYIYWNSQGGTVPCHQVPIPGTNGTLFFENNGGTTTCDATCGLDFSACIADVCGNGTIEEATEICDNLPDPDIFISSMSCQTNAINNGWVYSGGQFECNSTCDGIGGPGDCSACGDGTCSFVYENYNICASECNCGNTTIDKIDAANQEQCDSTNLNGITCQTIPWMPGYYEGGVLGCHAAGDAQQCEFDDSGCFACDESLNVSILNADAPPVNCGTVTIPGLHMNNDQTTVLCPGPCAGQDKDGNPKEASVTCLGGGSGYGITATNCTVCGNGVCDFNEDGTSCPADCICPLNSFVRINTCGEMVGLSSATGTLDHGDTLTIPCPIPCLTDSDVTVRCENTSLVIDDDTSCVLGNTCPAHTQIVCGSNFNVPAGLPHGGHSSQTCISLGCPSGTNISAYCDNGALTITNDCTGCGDGIMQTLPPPDPPDEECDYIYFENLSDAGDGILRCDQVQADWYDPDGTGVWYGTGTAECSTSCLKTTDCSGEYCGDGIPQYAHEQCDYIEFGVASKICASVSAEGMSSTAQGNFYGTTEQVTCNNDCTVTQNCNGYCGNNNLETAYEHCDLVNGNLEWATEWSCEGVILAAGPPFWYSGGEFDCQTCAYYYVSPNADPDGDGIFGNCWFCPDSVCNGIETCIPSSPNYCPDCDAECQPHCTNGVMDVAIAVPETGVDCGGECPTCCGDGVHDVANEECDYAFWQRNQEDGAGGISCGHTPVPGSGGASMFADIAGAFSYCNPDCTLDVSACTDTCGDGEVQGSLDFFDLTTPPYITVTGEWCDPGDGSPGSSVILDGLTCVDFTTSLGKQYHAGEFTCYPDCTGFAINSCEYCGDGICQDNYGEDNTNCPEDCWACPDSKDILVPDCGDASIATINVGPFRNVGANVTMACPGDCSTSSGGPVKNLNAACQADGSYLLVHDQCTVCGNNKCDWNEDHSNCPGDCLCGDGVCEDGYGGRPDDGESPGICPPDCHLCVNDVTVSVPDLCGTGNPVTTTAWSNNGVSATGDCIGAGCIGTGSITFVCDAGDGEWDVNVNACDSSCGDDICEDGLYSTPDYGEDEVICPADCKPCPAYTVNYCGVNFGGMGAGFPQYWVYTLPCSNAPPNAFCTVDDPTLVDGGGNPIEYRIECLNGAWVETNNCVSTCGNDVCEAGFGEDSSTCPLDCSDIPGCGDGVTDFDDESCDINDPATNSRACDTLMSPNTSQTYYAGTAFCEDCEFDFSVCWGYCGDGVCHDAAFAAANGTEDFGETPANCGDCDGFSCIDAGGLPANDPIEELTACAPWEVLTADTPITYAAQPPNVCPGNTVCEYQCNQAAGYPYHVLLGQCSQCNNGVLNAGEACDPQGNASGEAKFPAGQNCIDEHGPEGPGGWHVGNYWCDATCGGKLPGDGTCAYCGDHICQDGSNSTNDYHENPIDCPADCGFACPAGDVFFTDPNNTGCGGSGVTVSIANAAMAGELSNPNPACPSGCSGNIVYACDAVNGWEYSADSCTMLPGSCPDAPYSVSFSHADCTSHPGSIQLVSNDATTGIANCPAPCVASGTVNYSCSSGTWIQGTDNCTLCGNGDCDAGETHALCREDCCEPNATVAFVDPDNECDNNVTVDASGNAVCPLPCEATGTINYNCVAGNWVQQPGDSCSPPAPPSACSDLNVSICGQTVALGGVDNGDPSTLDCSAGGSRCIGTGVTATCNDGSFEPDPLVIDCLDHCTNAVQDNGETGLNCGGSCPPCPLPACESDIIVNTSCGGSVTILGGVSAGITRTGDCPIGCVGLYGVGAPRATCGADGNWGPVTGDCTDPVCPAIGYDTRYSSYTSAGGYTPATPSGDDCGVISWDDTNYEQTGLFNCKFLGNKMCDGSGTLSCRSGTGWEINDTCFLVNPEHCTNGVQDTAIAIPETGVDCGGECPACATCSDEIQNQNEEGVDCGGPCPPCQGCGFVSIDIDACTPAIPGDAVITIGPAEHGFGGAVPCPETCSDAENVPFMCNNGQWDIDISRCNSLIQNGRCYTQTRYDLIGRCGSGWDAVYTIPGSFPNLPDQTDSIPCPGTCAGSGNILAYCRHDDPFSHVYGWEVDTSACTPPAGTSCEATTRTLFGCDFDFPEAQDGATASVPCSEGCDLSQGTVRMACNDGVWGPVQDLCIKPAGTCPDSGVGACGGGIALDPQPYGWTRTYECPGHCTGELKVRCGSSLNWEVTSSCDGYCDERTIDLTAQCGGTVNLPEQVGTLANDGKFYFDCPGTCGGEVLAYCKAPVQSGLWWPYYTVDCGPSCPAFTVAGSSLPGDGNCLDWNVPKTKTSFQPFEVYSKCADFDPACVGNLAVYCNTDGNWNPTIFGSGCYKSGCDSFDVDTPCGPVTIPRSMANDNLFPDMSQPSVTVDCNDGCTGQLVYTCSRLTGWSHVSGSCVPESCPEKDFLTANNCGVATFPESPSNGAPVTIQCPNAPTCSGTLTRSCSASTWGPVSGECIHN